MISPLFLYALRRPRPVPPGISYLIGRYASGQERAGPGVQNTLSRPPVRYMQESDSRAGPGRGGRRVTASPYCVRPAPGSDLGEILGPVRSGKGGLFPFPLHALWRPTPVPLASALPMEASPQGRTGPDLGCGTPSSFRPPGICPPDGGLSSGQDRAGNGVGHPLPLPICLRPTIMLAP